jgi:hypothetical protein
LLPRDEERIQAQIEEAEATVDREVAEFEERRRREREDGGPESNEKSNSEANETVGESNNANPAIPSAPDASATNPTPTPSDVHKPAHEPVADDSGEVVVEADEDTVIY